MRYIELNPIRAAMVNHPGEYRWSSYLANAQGSADHIIEAHTIYCELGTSHEEQQTAYRELFRHHVDNDAMHEVREALNHELVLGRSYFKGRIEEITNRQARMGQPGRPRIEEEAGVYYVV